MILGSYPLRHVFGISDTPVLHAQLLFLTMIHRNPKLLYLRRINDQPRGGLQGLGQSVFKLLPLLYVISSPIILPDYHTPLRLFP